MGVQLRMWAGHSTGWACQSLLEAQGSSRDSAAWLCHRPEALPMSGGFLAPPTLNILSSVAGVSSVVAQVIHSSIWCAGEAASAIR